jgi:two-component system, cell cycle response regulator DivK
MTEQKTFILCIEDDETSQLILKTMFTQIMTNVDVQIWKDSADFVKKINALERVPQLIIMDIKVIPLDGFEMLKILRENDDFENVKIVAFTAGVMPQQVNKLKEAGFNGLISKPIVRDIFPQIINSLLRGESIWYIS